MIATAKNGDPMQGTAPAAKVFRCRQCRAVIGVDDGHTLTVGAAVLLRSVTIQCQRCDYIAHWKPHDNP